MPMFLSLFFQLSHHILIVKWVLSVHLCIAVSGILLSHIGLLLVTHFKTFCSVICPHMKCDSHPLKCRMSENWLKLCSDPSHHHLQSQINFYVIRKSDLLCLKYVTTYYCCQWLTTLCYTCTQNLTVSLSLFSELEY